MGEELSDRGGVLKCLRHCHACAVRSYKLTEAQRSLQRYDDISFYNHHFSGMWNGDRRDNLVVFSGENIFNQPETRDQSSEVVYISRHGKRYHVGQDCPTLSKSTQLEKRQLCRICLKSSGLKIR